MRRIFLIVYIITSLFIGIQASFALDYSKISTNAKIVAALNALDSINRRDVIAILYGRNATKKPIRVVFRDLAMYGYKDCEALTVPTRNNGLIIYINSEHKGASVECIACLIAHESQHHTFTNSKQEELRAWISETQAWNELVKRNRTLLTSSEPLAKRENYIARIRTKSGVVGIQKIIASNPVYAGLD
ncbi:MAG: hypothetical protein IJ877_03825 [Candidatus Gastranaerophilales bacterium]|nr:hypothetical protein [Candidatus Gastranaerophilales bacterium]